jgi:hypothetical protein
MPECRARCLQHAFAQNPEMRQQEDEGRVVADP